MLSEARKEAIFRHIEPIPVVRNLRFQIESMEEGRCVTIVPKDHRFDGAYGAYHGGLLTTAADSIACLAIWTVLGPEAHLTTADLHIRFLAACFTDAVVDARVIKIGRSLCPVEVNIRDTDGNHVAVAQVTYFRLDAAVRTPPSGD
ncbi:MAG TPA: PaaI family thioesterase [Phycisphaerae bacterium]|nr:PaaI family thioesterase [Phycisphaerae bacterium]HRW52852.1 PaaI family thioesterase [Phycisphaerae bacterium]